MCLLGTDYFSLQPSPLWGLLPQAYFPDPLHSYSNPEFPKVSNQSFQLHQFVRKYHVYPPPASFPFGSVHDETDAVLNNYPIYQTMTHPWDSLVI